MSATRQGPERVKITDLSAFEGGSRIDLVPFHKLGDYPFEEVRRFFEDLGYYMDWHSTAGESPTFEDYVFRHPDVTGLPEPRQKQAWRSCLNRLQEITQKAPHAVQAIRDGDVRYTSTVDGLLLGIHLSAGGAS